MTTKIGDQATKTESPKVPSEEAFVDALRRVVVPLDIVALLFPAILFVAVGTLPLALREQLAFSYTDPDMVTALTASYVHANSSHMFRNLTAYLVVVPTAFLISVLADRKQLFYTLFILVFAVFPFVLSGLNLIVPREALSLGASGLTLAFVGYLPVAIAEYVRRRFYVGNIVRRSIAGALFFVGLIIVIPLTVATIRPRLAVVLVFVAFLAVVGYSVGLQRSGVNRSMLRGSPPGFLELSIWSIGIFVVALITAFPTDPLSDSGVVNTYTHFIGYALGFLNGYIVALLSFETN